MIRVSPITLATKKEIAKTKICVLSDIHYRSMEDQDLLNDLKKTIIAEKPDYICIPGDIIDNPYRLNDQDWFILFTWFQSLPYPILITMGNHDITARCHHRLWEYDITKWKQALSQIPHLHLLEKNSFLRDNIEFLGYNPSFEYYMKAKEKDEVLIRELKQAQLSYRDSEAYHVFLFHTPHTILKDQIRPQISILSDTDLFLAGHQHAGMVPYIVQKHQTNPNKAHRGIISAFKSPLPKNAYGHLRRDNLDAVISPGVKKLVTNFRLLNQLGTMIYPYQIYTVTIEKS